MSTQTQGDQTAPTNKFYAAYKNLPTIKEGERLVSGMVSTIDVDMVGDVVLPEGMDTSTYFDTTRSVNLDHDPGAIVGTNRNIKAIAGSGVWTTTYVSKTAFGEDVYTMIKEGVIRGLSIEWDPRSVVFRAPTPADVKKYGMCKRIMERWTLTSYAFTAQPMNPYCVVDGVKSARAIGAQTAVWEGLVRLVEGGKILKDSAVRAGLPESMLVRKNFRVPHKTIAHKPKIMIDGCGNVWKMPIK